MAFPTVETTNTSAETSDVQGETDHTVSLPTGITADDLLLIFAGLENANGTIFSDPSGFTKLFEDNFGDLTGRDSRLVIWYKKATGSEGSTVAFQYDAISKSAHISYRISGADDPGTGQAPEAAAVATGDSTSPNPPSLTPTGGAKDYLWIAAASADDNNSPTVSGFPTNYSNGLSSRDLSDATCMTAERQLNASSEDPDSFTISGAAKWPATTVAVHPSGGGGGGGGLPIAVATYHLNQMRK